MTHRYMTHQYDHPCTYLVLACNPDSRGSGGSCGDNMENQIFCLRNMVGDDVDVTIYSWTYFEAGWYAAQSHTACPGPPHAAACFAFQAAAGGVGGRGGVQWGMGRVRAVCVICEGGGGRRFHRPPPHLPSPPTLKTPPRPTSSHLPCLPSSLPPQVQNGRVQERAGEHPRDVFLARA